MKRTLEIKRLALLLAFALPVRLAALDVCPLTGDKTVVGEIQVLFDCAEVSGAQAVQWFTRAGKFKGQFTIIAGKITAKVGPGFNFEPQDLRIAAPSARGCSGGDYEVKEDGSACYARFRFPCAAKKFQLKVAPESEVGYSVTRLIPAPPEKPATPCKQDYDVPPFSTTQFSDTETIEVKISTLESEKRLVAIYRCNPQWVAAPCKPQPTPSATPGHGSAARNLEYLRRPAEKPLPVVTVTLQPSR